MPHFFKRYIADQSGATAIEYALIAGGIFIAIVTVIFLTGDSAVDLYQNISDRVSWAVASMS